MRDDDGSFGIGQPVRRVEDPALLRGEGRFIDDLDRPGQLHAHFLRSPHPHACIVAIDADAARALPGVVAVLTGADLAADGVGEMKTALPLKNRDGTPIRIPPRRAMATDAVHHAGETVAVVLAETEAAAADAAEAVAVDYEPLPAVSAPDAALAPGAPVLWPEMGTNLVLDWQLGDHAAAVEAAFAAAAHVTRLTLVNNRLVVAALEPRGVLAEYDRIDRRYTVYTPTQGASPVATALAASLGVPATAIRLVTTDVGGGFGIKNGLYPEQVVCAWAARRLGRPVKWYGGRADAFQTDYHARDHVMEAALALDRDGRMLALRCETTSNMGAYVNGGAPIIPTGGGTRVLANVYKVPLVHAATRCVVTNTTPIAAYRGAGKPEFVYVVERLIDRAARELALDPAELRRRNLIGPADMPYRTPTGMVYDSGEFERCLDAALALGDRDGLQARRADALRRGRLLGQGLAMYTEPDGFRDGRVHLAFDPTGQLTLAMTGQTNGQGHATTFAQVAVSLLGVPFAAVHVLQGDTDRVGHGSGTGGSRTTTVAGTGIHIASQKLIEKGRQIAAHMLEAGVDDVEFAAGEFRIAGTDRAVDILSVARTSFQTGRVPPGMELGFEATAHYDAPAYSYPSGAHVAEVEIDRETGAVHLTRYALASDFGVVVNPMLVEGQLHGGIVQGVGQALTEEARYDADSGQLVTGSFMDYCLPRAREVPQFDWQRIETRCTTNPLGVKGCGESGPTVSCPAVMNAVMDALRDYDTSELQMPATAERVWRVLAGGESTLPA